MSTFQPLPARSLSLQLPENDDLGPVTPDLTGVASPFAAAVQGLFAGVQSGEEKERGRYLEEREFQRKFYDAQANIINQSANRQVQIYESKNRMAIAGLNAAAAANKARLEELRLGIDAAKAGTAARKSEFSMWAEAREVQRQDRVDGMVRGIIGDIDGALGYTDANGNPITTVGGNEFGMAPENFPGGFPGAPGVSPPKEGKTSRSLKGLAEKIFRRNGKSTNTDAPPSTDVPPPGEEFPAAEPDFFNELDADGNRIQPDDIPPDQGLTPDPIPDGFGAVEGDPPPAVPVQTQASPAPLEGADPAPTSEVEKYEQERKESIDYAGLAQMRRTLARVEKNVEAVEAMGSDYAPIARVKFNELKSRYLADMPTEDFNEYALVSSDVWPGIPEGKRQAAIAEVRGFKTRLTPKGTEAMLDRIKLEQADEVKQDRPFVHQIKAFDEAAEGLVSLREMRTNLSTQGFLSKEHKGLNAWTSTFARVLKKFTRDDGVIDLDGFERAYYAEADFTKFIPQGARTLLGLKGVLSDFDMRLAMDAFPKEGNSGEKNLYILTQFEKHIQRKLANTVKSPKTFTQMRSRLEEIQDRYPMDRSGNPIYNDGTSDSGFDSGAGAAAPAPAAAPATAPVAQFTGDDDFAHFSINQSRGTETSFDASAARGSSANPVNYIEVGSDEPGIVINGIRVRSTQGDTAPPKPGQVFAIVRRDENGELTDAGVIYSQRKK